jgi:hypothetical protein
MTESEDARDEGMSRAEHGVDPQWWAAALEVVTALARRRDTFTTDSVWNTLEQWKPELTVHEPRVMGPLMAQAARDGLVVRTEERVKSTLVRAHARPLCVYRSALR